jgi:N-dimethylarginine dimethylaminohydrolase
MASPTESSTSARFADPTEGKEEGINELLKRLGFEEDEVDDLIFEEESDVPLDGIKWMALARVHTSNYFSIQTFEQHMNTAWSPAKEVKFRALENNLFYNTVFLSR